MRKLDSKSKTGSALLDAPEGDLFSQGQGQAQRTAEAPTEFRRPLGETLRARREMVDTLVDDADTEAFLRASGCHRRVRRVLIPRSRNGRIAAAVAVGALLLGLGAGSLLTMRYVTTSDKFRIPTSQSIEIDGNSHVSRSQMLSIFGGDVDGNIFRVPLEERRAQLQQMPWVEHATVMRLLPNRLRVSVIERVPIAFVRQGGTIGMVDANGVLLDIPPDAPGNPNYSFPVVTGIKADDNLASRARRMKLYSAFIKDLDSDGKGTTQQLSEVDLSDPEDVKALIPDHNSEVLVHFGAENFLHRYHSFQDHIVEWRQQYARLSAVDMRYERQVVLQMPPKDTASITPPDAAKADAARPDAAKPEIKPVADAAKRIAPAATAVVAKPDVSKAKRARVVAKRVEGVKPTKGAKGQAAKAIAMQKRVDAIKAWMARREKIRMAQAPRKISLLDPVANSIAIPPVSAVPANGGGVHARVTTPTIAPVGTTPEAKFVAGKYHATQVVQHP